MVKLNKIYTRTGDKGSTHLVGGDRIEKSSLRVDAFGEVDELNSYIGVIRTLAKDGTDFSELMSKIQNELFDIGSILATAHGATWNGMRSITDEQIKHLENKIDAALEGLPELRSFVLPGGTIMNAELHRTRTVCRRAERVIWRLNKEETVDPNILTYINRLSDLLFALARRESFSAGTPEYLWK